MLPMLGCVLITTAAHAAAPVTFDFEADDAAAGWTATGAGAAAQTTTVPKRVRAGKAALACSYLGQPGSPFSLTHDQLDIAGARSLSFSLKASSQAPLVLALTEEDGSVYHTFVTCPADQWCDIALPLGDFQLQDGSQDDNGALDADQVRTFAIQELANLPGEMGEIFGTKRGDQWLCIDNVRFLTEETASRSTVERGKVLIDDFSRPWFQLLPAGSAELTHVPGREGDQRSAVSIGFTFAPSGPREWPGVVLPVGHVDLSGATAVRVRVKGRGPLKLHLLLEEQDGSRYETSGVCSKAREWQTKDFALADFQLEPSRSDENNHLDPEQLRVLVIVGDTFNSLLDEQERGEYALNEVLFLTQ